MSRKKQSIARKNPEPYKPSSITPQQSKLDRRMFSLPKKEQEKILTYYRDRGLTYGKAGR